MTMIEKAFGTFKLKYKNKKGNKLVANITGVIPDPCDAYKSHLFSILVFPKGNINKKQTAENDYSYKVSTKFNINKHQKETILILGSKTANADGNYYTNPAITKTRLKIVYPNLKLTDDINEASAVLLPESKGSIFYYPSNNYGYSVGVKFNTSKANLLTKDVLIKRLKDQFVAMLPGTIPVDKKQYASLIKNAENDLESCLSFLDDSTEYNYFIFKKEAGFYWYRNSSNYPTYTGVSSKNSDNYESFQNWINTIENDFLFGTNNIKLLRESSLDLYINEGTEDLDLESVKMLKTLKDSKMSMALQSKFLLNFDLSKEINLYRLAILKPVLFPDRSASSTNLGCLMDKLETYYEENIGSSFISDRSESEVKVLKFLKKKNDTEMLTYYFDNFTEFGKAGFNIKINNKTDDVANIQT